MIVIKLDETCVVGRGKIFIVSSNYYKLLKKDDKICVDGKYYIIRGMEASIPLGYTIGLVVTETDNDDYKTNCCKMGYYIDRVENKYKCQKCRGDVTEEINSFFN